MASITSANAVYLLSINALYNTAQQLQGFSADEIYATDPLESAEVLMGVDGILSAGFVYVPVKQMVSLQADSASNNIFENWWTSQQQIKDVYFATGIITLPSISKQFTLTQGVLSTFPPTPDAGKTLKPRKYGITWQSIVASILS
jgi:hypothetical protein